MYAGEQSTYDVAGATAKPLSMLSYHGGILPIHKGSSDAVRKIAQFFTVCPVGILVKPFEVKSFEMSYQIFIRVSSTAAVQRNICSLHFVFIIVHKHFCGICTNNVTRR